MSTAVKRALALACFLALAATPYFAAAQEDYADEDAPADLSEIFDGATTQSVPTVDEAMLGVPAQALEFAVTQAPTLAGTAISVPARFLVVDNHFEVHADGTSTASSHIELQLLSPQAISALAQPALTFSDSMQDLQIRNAYTLKKDGTRLPVSPDAILVRQKTMPSPYFSDLKEKVILFPNVEPGDTLVYDSVLRSQPAIPGQFYFGASIPRAVEIDSDTITMTAPRSFPLAFDSYGLPVQKTAEGDNLVYTIRYSNRAPILELPQFLANTDHGLRVFASSAPTFDAMAAGYAPLIASKIVVTPGILAKANDITAGVGDRREQARKLYEWVSAHIRYVALIFGDGGLVPHAADAILANGYGDCKDHAVLYSALLKAKGISAEPVVINATNGYFVPQVPQLQTFNHMIVWLPEFGLYADTTSNSTPFGALPQFEYGKSVIRVGDSRAALQHTPVLTEADSAYSSNTSLRLDDDGKLTGTHYATATGSLSGVLRTLANQTAVSGLNTVAGAVLRARKMDAATGSITFPPTADLTQQYSYSSNYQLARAFVGDGSLALPEGLNLVNAYSAALLGPAADIRYATSDSLPCFGGKLVDDYTLQLPADKRVTSLPPDGIVRTANLDYRSHWTLTGNTLSVHRELHAHFDKALCTGDLLRETRVAVLRIQRDYTARIGLETAHAS